jgi:hypothetical protein
MAKKKTLKDKLLDELHYSHWSAEEDKELLLAFGEMCAEPPGEDFDSMINSNNTFFEKYSKYFSKSREDILKRLGELLQ